MVTTAGVALLTVSAYEETGMTAGLGAAGWAPPPVLGFELDSRAKRVSPPRLQAPRKKIRSAKVTARTVMVTLSK
jgi:hypothetical protein